MQPKLNIWRMPTLLLATALSLSACSPTMPRVMNPCPKPPVHLLTPPLPLVPLPLPETSPKTSPGVTPMLPNFRPLLPGTPGLKVL